MAWTWEQILTDALSLSGILGDDQPVNPQMLGGARLRASQLLDELDGRGIALPPLYTEIAWTLTPNQPRYVLGVGADASPASTVRPELILNGQVQIALGSQPTYIQMSPMSFQEYRNVAVPLNASQPFQYSLNPTWPQAEIYFYPSPAQAYPVRFACQVKWESIVTDPATQTTTLAQLPSGFTNAFTNVLALRIAERSRLDTAKLEKKAEDALFFMATTTWQNVPDREINTPDMLPWNVIQAGRNPW